MVRKDLGMVTAYAYAVSKGYTGTEEEFAELMASYATVAESAEASAQAAAGSASSAAGSATNASGSASAAAGSASAAASSASTASTKAENATTSATAAAGSATTASTKAGEAASSASAAAQSATQAAGSASAAAQSATNANTAKTDAQAAKTVAETAQEKAEEAQAAAEAAAQTLVIDDTLTQENQAAEAKAVGDALKTKAEIDGYYQDMTVGDAEQLVSSQYVEDNAPYKFRTSGGSADIGNRAYVDKIVGGTIGWNQLGKPLSDWTNEGVTKTVEDGVATITPYQRYGRISYGINFIANHKMLISGYLKLSNTTNANNVSFSIYGVDTTPTPQARYCRETTDWQHIEMLLTSSSAMTLSNRLIVTDARESDWGTIQAKKLMCFDLTQMLGPTIADAIYAMEQASAGAGVAWFKKLFPKDYYDYNAGELISVSGLQSYDMVGFNQWDEEWANGNFDTNGNIIANANTFYSKNYIAVIPNTSYFFKASNTQHRLCYYDADKNFISRSELFKNNTVFTIPSDCHYIRFHNDGTSYNPSINPICINLSWSGTRNGEYKPYEKHSYPLDSTLTLRGIPKLSADNQLYFDGDEYASDGKVNRRYGVVDLGTLNWGKSGNALFYTTSLQSLIKKGTTEGGFDHIKCVKYVAQNVPSSSALNDKCMSVDVSGNVQIIDANYASNTVADFKSAMSGVMLVYELATSTEETAEPYSGIQLVNDWGTEEYVSGTICPVGHETRYPADLVKKLEGLPTDFSALIAPTEATTTASRAYTVGSYLILNNTLYKVTSAIANGATITPGTNATATTIMAELMAMA